MLALTIVSVLIAAASLAILVLQELRQRRERPRFFLRARVAGFVTVPPNHRWEIVEVTNNGGAVGTQLLVAWGGVELRSSGPHDWPFAYGVPSVMRPGETVKIAVRSDDIDRAWLHYTVIIHQTGVFGVGWQPLTRDGEAGEVWREQWAALHEQRRLKWRFWLWRRSRRPQFRRGPARPVGPYVDGIAIFRRAPRHASLDEVTDMTATLSGLNGELRPGFARLGQTDAGA